jgi:hypothetical protein
MFVRVRIYLHSCLCVGVYVCVCVRERHRQVQRHSVCVYVGVYAGVAGVEFGFLEAWAVSALSCVRDAAPMTCPVSARPSLAYGLPLLFDQM